MRCARPRAVATALALQHDCSPSLYGSRQSSSVTATPPANPQHVQLMLAFYYIMTGLHAVHMLVGMVLLVWLVLRCTGAC